MYRFSPIARSLVDWDTIHSLYLAPLSVEDHAQILDATRRIEGSDATAARAYWIKRRPDAFKIVRASAGRAIGFIFSLTIECLTKEAARADRMTAAAFEYVEQTAALRPGEVIHFLYALDYERPHGMPRHAWLHVEGTLRWNCTPQLAWSFVQVGRRARAVVLPLLAHFRHFPALDVEVDGKTYTLAAHDWRREPSSVLAQHFASVELHGVASDFRADEDTLLVLSEAAFGEAVRAGLRDYSKPEALSQNPLCRSRVVLEICLPEPHEPLASPSEQRVTRLAAALKLAVQSLAQGARDQKLAQILEHTYIEPAPTQDIAAELVGLPFSTYRRHLATAVARVTSWLWQRETSGWTA
jgi:hypothetical protein